jgi:hypothetical protein
MRLSQIVKLLDTRFNKKRGNKEEKGKKERKRSGRHIETPMKTPSVPLERPRRDESQ